MSQIVTDSVQLTEGWRWQEGTSLRDVMGIGGAVIDGEDNLIIAGSVSIVYRNRDDDGKFATYKLDGATGDPLWSWTGSSDANSHHSASSVAVDRAGDIIGGGMTNGAWSPSKTDGVGSHDWAAFKLDGDQAEELWRYQRSFQYDNATGWGTIFCVDTTSEGDALFVGYSGVENSGYNEIQYVVTKVDGITGEEIWTVDGGLAGTLDLMWGCAVDSRDNLVTVGITEANLGGSATDTAGTMDAVVVKFDPSGEEIWVYQDGTDLWDDAYAVAIDSEDNVYVGGGDEVLHGSITVANYSTVRKLDGSSGEELWKYEGVSPRGDGCIFFGISVEESTGLVVAAGLTDGLWESGGAFSGGRSDFAAALLNATTGEELGRWQGGTATYDQLVFAGFDAEGSLLLAGRTDGSWGQPEGDYDFVAMKFVQRADADSDGWRTVIVIVIWSAAAVLIVTAILAGICFSRKRKASLKAPADAAAVAPQAGTVPLPPPDNVSASRPPRYMSFIWRPAHSPPPPYSAERTGAVRDFPRAEAARQKDRTSGNREHEGQAEDNTRREGSEPPPPYKSMRFLFGGR